MSSSQNAIDSVGERLRVIANVAHTTRDAKRIVDQSMLAQAELGKVRVQYLNKIEPILEEIDKITMSLGAPTSGNLLSKTQKIRQELRK